MTHSASTARIVEIRPHRGGCELALRCDHCQQTFEVHQETIGGLAFGRHACPSCRIEYDVLPDEFAAAVKERLATDLPGTAREAEAATELAESWHRTPAFSALLTYEGVELGPPTERELLACINEALMQMSQRRVR